ncbi:hypothetical protein BHE74_00004715 [Ensete ventricosum]|nr:hypothetical protein GW17_00005259 [Ensete ventricosum]RWW86508.1 hypothetical protein BHE74_00004715 [Ensete ventricosum]
MPRPNYLFYIGATVILLSNYHCEVDCAKYQPCVLYVCNEEDIEGHSDISLSKDLAIASQALKSNTTTMGPMFGSPPSSPPITQSVSTSVSTLLSFN